VQKGAPYLPTPMVVGDYLYIVLGNGIVTCYRAETGDKVWSKRLGDGGTFTSSPVAAGGKLYFANEDGDVYVLKAGPEYELLAQNHLGEAQMATAAITGDTILYRTQHHLYALKEK
jgi:outer membrane protein assembly factor BamB